MRRMPWSRAVGFVVLAWAGPSALAAEPCYVEERRLVAVSEDGRYAEYVRTDTLDTARIYSLVEISSGRQLREFGCESHKQAAVCKTKAPKGKPVPAHEWKNDPFRDAPELRGQKWLGLGSKALADLPAGKARPVETSAEGNKVRVTCEPGKPRTVDIEAALEEGTRDKVRLLGAARVGGRVLLSVGWGSNACGEMFGTTLVDACGG